MSKGPSRPARLAAAVLLFAVIAAAGLFTAAGCRPTVSDGTGLGSGGDLASPSFSELIETPAAEEFPGQLVVYFLDTGQSDATYIRTPDGKVLLVDTGEERNTVADFLRAKGVTRVDTLVLTHPHADHIGGALAILNQFEVGTLVDSAFPHPTELYADVLARAVELTEGDDGKLVYVKGRAGMSLDCGPEVTAQVLHPTEPLGSDANNASVVLRLVYGSFALLLTGDIQTAGEDAILTQSPELGATVLKVAHHGSDSSSGAEFLEACHPAVAVIEVGAGNDYGHPSPAVVERLVALGAEVYRTDLDGTVVVHTDGTDWGVVTASGAGGGAD